MLFTVVFILSLFMRITCSKFYEEMAERAFDELTSMTVCAGIGVGSGGARRTSKRRDGDGCRKTSTRVYVDDSYNRSLRAHLPDGPLAAGATTRVNGFLVLDPFPDDEYGHFVAIFAFWMCDTDNNNRENNIQLETGVCLRLLSKCGNRSTDFLPATFVDRHSTTFMENPCFSIEVGEIAVVRPMKRHELKCRNLTSFQVCPPIVKQTAQSLKINVDENPTLVEEKLMGTYKGERFVHRTAIIVRGSSWPNYIASIQRRTSMQNEFFRLRDNLIRRGFDPRWILSFYDNGIFHDVVRNFTNVYAAKKSYIRRAIEKICATKTTVIRNLIIYFVGSATGTGSFLLHDFNRDGIAQENERIIPPDLKSMLESCTVQKIHVVADYPNSIELLRQYFGTQVELRLPEGPVPLERSTSRENEFLDMIL